MHEYELDDLTHLQRYDRTRLLERAGQHDLRVDAIATAVAQAADRLEPSYAAGSAPLVVLALPAELSGIGRALVSLLSHHFGQPLWLWQPDLPLDSLPRGALFLSALPGSGQGALTQGGPGQGTLVDLTAWISAEHHPAQTFLVLLGLLRRLAGPVDAKIDETTLEALLSFPGSQLWPAHCAPDVPLRDNPAKQLAWHLHERVPLFWGEGPLAGVAVDWALRYQWYAEAMALGASSGEMARMHVMARLPRYWPNTVSLVRLQHGPASPSGSAETLDYIFRRRRFTARVVSAPADLPLPAAMVHLLALGEWVALYAAILANVDPADRVPLQLLEPPGNEI
ncbi:hypothetical protein FKZ61_005295 [Litorilinea aerophila]|nr:SIS domain-containing protein [Litorilinea aerophila]MCC9075524.1 hypothetical protein [Litorilinea aerophila]GIV76410.1 MAG: hypothetical protein KatS3mg050_0804 [Litorilinea sp.]